MNAESLLAKRVVDKQNSSQILELVRRLTEQNSLSKLWRTVGRALPKLLPLRKGGVLVVEGNQPCIVSTFSSSSRNTTLCPLNGWPDALLPRLLDQPSPIWWDLKDDSAFGNWFYNEPLGAVLCAPIHGTRSDQAGLILVLEEDSRDDPGIIMTVSEICHYLSICLDRLELKLRVKRLGRRSSTRRSQAYQRGGEDPFDLIEELDDLLWVLDVESQSMTYVSSACSKLTDFSQDDLLKDAQCLFAKAVPEDQERLKEAFQNIGEDGFDEEYGLIRDSGEKIWLHTRAKPIDSQSGKQRVAGLTRNISGKKWIEEAHKRFATILETTPDFVGIFNAEGMLVYINHAGRMMIGLSEMGSLHDLSILDLIPPEEAEFIHDEAIPTVDDQGTWIGETWFQDIQRTHFIPVSMTIIAHRSQKGEIEYYSTISRDVTALREAEERLDRFFTLSLDLLCIGNIQTRQFERVNPSFCRLLEYSEDELLSLPMDSFIHEEDRVESVRVMLSEKTVSGFENRVISKSGQVHWLSWKYTVADNGLLYGTARDITEERQNKAALRAARDEAEAASRAKSEFLANMSHEIRTPMNGMMGMIGLLIQTELSHEQYDYARTARNSGQALLTVINDILDFSKIEAGKLEIEAFPFDLRLATEEVAELMAPTAEDKKLELIVRYSPETPRYLIGDVGRVRQILTNLVSNAIKFTETGHVLINVEGFTKDKQASITLSVEDSGIGIDQTALPKLFDKFTQADASTTRKYGGTGLGLAICRQLAELMGGEIGAQSVQGEGSKFWFTLNLPYQVKTFEDSKFDRSSLQGVRILVVDDSEINRRVLVEQVSKYGMKASTAASADEALKELEYKWGQLDPYEMLLLDDVMPGKNGEELAEELRQNPRLRNIPIVLLTSMQRRFRRQDENKLLFQAILAKPVRASELLQSLARVWGETSSSTSVRRFTGQKNTLFTSSMLSPPSSLSHESKKPKVDPEKKNRARVLVAEDNIINQKVALGMLGKLGCTVDAAANGLEAVKMLQLAPYDLIFMDCQMPEMDGFEATGRIRQLEGRESRSPIVAMTANAMQGDRERCLEAGMDDYVAKPVKIEDFERMLERWVPIVQAVEASSSAIMSSSGIALELAREALTEPTLDPEVLTKLVEDMGEDASHRCFQVFLKDSRSILNRMEQGRPWDDLRSLERTVTSLREIAKDIGAVALVTLCEALEFTCKTNNSEHAGQLIERISGELFRVELELMKSIA